MQVLNRAVEPKSDAPLRRTQIERSEESGRRLVQAAIELIAEAGVAAATFDAIGRRAGYSRGLATQRFGSKQGLIDAVVEHLHEQLDQSLDAAGIHDLTGLEGLIAFAGHHLLQMRDSVPARAYHVLLAGTVGELSPMRSIFAASHERVEQLLEGLVRKGQAEGDIPPDLDARQAALLIGSLLLGVSLQTLVDPAMQIAPIRTLILQSLRENRLLNQKPAGT